jgi:geranylgeranyl pyrophosphate synthase
VLVHGAVAIELLHLASLVHDDIIDEATERRGVPALHVALGRDRALVVGDLLIVAAFEELGRVRGASAAVATLSEGARLCCLGQLTELGRHMVSETDYLDVVAKKTGALFAAAASLGGVIAGAPDDDVAALAAFGTALGSAYQIRDDLHDGALFTPTLATYACARNVVLEALTRVPASCDDALRALANEALGGFSQTDMS